VKRKWLHYCPIVLNNVVEPPPKPSNSSLNNSNSSVPETISKGFGGTKIPKSGKASSQPSLRHLPRQKDNRGGRGTSESPEGVVIMPCTTISTCEHYDLAKVVDLFYAQGMRSAAVILPGEMVHVKYPFGAGKSADVLILVNGTIVAWGMTEVEVMEQLVVSLKSAEVRSYKDVETEDMDFIEEYEGQDEGTQTEGGKTSPVVIEPSPFTTESTMIGEIICIRGNTPTERLLNKAAFSSGLARNTKLAALEISLENYISSIKEITTKLATGSKLGFNGSDVLKITGQLLQIRGQLNLYSELIETPDLYWTEPELESLYTLISKKLDIAPRISILNKKLDYASELVGILKTHTSEQQSTRLEWMIIILIMVEVGFETIHFFERYWDKKQSDTN
jgi:uncharacterized Rmd1/YagE family protein